MAPSGPPVYKLRARPVSGWPGRTFSEEDSRSTPRAVIRSILGTPRSSTSGRRSILEKAFQEDNPTTMNLTAWLCRREPGSASTRSSRCLRPAGYCWKD